MFPSYYNFTSLWLLPLLEIPKESLYLREAGSRGPASRLYSAYLNIDQNRCIDIVTHNYQDIHFLEFENHIMQLPGHIKSQDYLNGHFCIRTFEIAAKHIELEEKLCKGLFSTLTDQDVSCIQEFSILDDSLVYLYHTIKTDTLVMFKDNDFLFNHRLLHKSGLKLPLPHNINF